MSKTPPHGQVSAVDPLTLLQWQIDMGASVCIDENPTNWFEGFKAERPATASNQECFADPTLAQTTGSLVDSQTNRANAAGKGVSARQELDFPKKTSVKIPDDAACYAAREQAKTATDLATLKSILENFDGCNLRFGAKSTVFGDGNPNAQLMFVGEAPGREEDHAGVPFIGRSGQMLNMMLAAIGLEREAVYIANVIPWRPPGNRTPTPQETEICRPFIERQIALINPKILVFLGGASAKTLLNTQSGILKLRGRWHQYQASESQSPPVDCMAMLHPAFLLRQPAQKKLAWQDLLRLEEKLQLI